MELLFHVFFIGATQGAPGSLPAGDQLMALLVGAVSAAVYGLLAISCLLRYLRTRGPGVLNAPSPVSAAVVAIAPAVC